MTNLLYRAAVLVGDVANFVADLLPGTHDDWLERHYDTAVALTFAEAGLPEPDSSTKLVQPRVVDRLGEDCRDAEWASHYGLHWQWIDPCWWYEIDGSWCNVPAYYTPTLGPFTEVVSSEVNQ